MNVVSSVLAISSFCCLVIFSVLYFKNIVLSLFGFLLTRKVHSSNSLTREILEKLPEHIFSDAQENCSTCIARALNGKCLKEKCAVKAFVSH